MDVCRQYAGKMSNRADLRNKIESKKKRVHEMQENTLIFTIWGRRKKKEQGFESEIQLRARRACKGGEKTEEKQRLERGE